MLVPSTLVRTSAIRWVIKVRDRTPDTAAIVRLAILLLINTMIKLFLIWAVSVQTEQ